MVNIRLLLLAAGASRRLGEPKQLLQWGEESIIEHQIKTLLATNKQVSVILGAYADVLRQNIHNFPIDIIINKHWNTGMGSSIAHGVAEVIQKDATTDGILIALIDQPLITTNHYERIMKDFEVGKKQIIVSSSDKGWFGAPVLFDKVYFNELLSLKGDDGAKVVANRYRDSIVSINGGEMLADIDTPEAYRKLLDIYRRTNT